jgi:hypothetical protein
MIWLVQLQPKIKRIQGLQTALNNSVSRLIEMNTRLVAANNELDALKAGKTTAQNGQTEAPAKQPWKSSSGRSMLDPAAPPSDASAPNGVGTEKHNAMLAARLAILGKNLHKTPLPRESREVLSFSVETRCGRKS